MTPRSMLRGPPPEDGAGVDYTCRTCHHVVTYTTKPDRTPWCYGKPIRSTKSMPTMEHSTEPTRFELGDTVS